MPQLLSDDDLASIETQVLATLDTTVTVMPKESSSDSIGGRSVTYGEGVEVAGRVVHSDVSYQTVGDRIVTTTTARFVLPKDTVVNMGDKLVHEGVDYNVVSAPVTGLITLYVDANLQRA